MLMPQVLQNIVKWPFDVMFFFYFHFSNLLWVLMLTTTLFQVFWANVCHSLSSWCKRHACLCDTFLCMCKTKKTTKTGSIADGKYFLISVNFYHLQKILSLLSNKIFFNKVSKNLEAQVFHLSGSKYSY